MDLFSELCPKTIFANFLPLLGPNLEKGPNRGFERFFQSWPSVRRRAAVLEFPGLCLCEDFIRVDSGIRLFMARSACYFERLVYTMAYCSITYTSGTRYRLF